MLAMCLLLALCTREPELRLSCRFMHLWRMQRGDDAELTVSTLSPRSTGS